MQNIDTKKIETADERILATLKDVDTYLQKDEWAYKRTKFDLRDDKTLKITREAFTMFDLRGIDEAATANNALWYIGSAYPSNLDVTITLYVN